MAEDDDTLILRPGEESLGVDDWRVLDGLPRESRQQVLSLLLSHHERLERRLREATVPRHLGVMTTIGSHAGHDLYACPACGHVTAKPTAPHMTTPPTHLFGWPMREG